MRPNAEGPEGLRGRKAEDPPCKPSGERRSGRGCGARTAPGSRRAAPPCPGRSRIGDVQKTLPVHPKGIWPSLMTIPGSMSRARIRHTSDGRAGSPSDGRNAAHARREPGNEHGPHPRRHPPDGGRGHRARHATRRHTRVQCSPRKDLPSILVSKLPPCPTGRGSIPSRPRSPPQYHSRIAPAPQPGREYPAVHTRQPAPEPCPP